jgi:hypothetical protein
MSKFYYVEVKFKKERWTLIDTYTKQEDAMEHVHSETKLGNTYPMRVVRVVRTIVFDGSKT